MHMEHEKVKNWKNKVHQIKREEISDKTYKV